MRYHHLTLTAAAAVLALTFGGCNGDKSTDLQDSLNGNTVDDLIAGYTLFDPTTGTIPYPNNILFAPNSSSTNDYDFGQTLNIPYEPTDADANVKRQLNTLTGFSTTMPITAPISDGVTLDATSLPVGVQLYKVDVNASGYVTDINATLQYGVDFAVAQSGSKVAIVPMKPLEPLTNYMAVLTNDLNDSEGRILAPDYATALTLSPNPVEAGGALDEATAAALEAIRQGNQAMLYALAMTGKDPTKTVQVWTFRTQMIGAVQNSIALYAQNDTNAALAIQDVNVTTKALFAQLGMDTSLMSGSAEIYAGTLSNLPQYMPQGSPMNPLPILAGEFSYSAPFTPIIEANVTVPVVATVPSAASGCTKPAAGWPVVIYQHGITRVRTDLFVYGETLASACYVGVAIDLPLHGVTESNTTLNPFYMGALERTFNVDLVTENPYGTVTGYAPDGVIDSTGIHFMNLANVTTTRDNLQQTTSDLIELTNSIASAVVFELNATLSNLDGSRISFLSHSLGNIASIGYLNQTDALQSAVMMMPGQQMIPFLINSPVFAPEINAGLAVYGIMPGTEEYAAFMLATQTMIDDADPANYAAGIGAANTFPILEMQAIGDGTEGSGDQHIPAVVAGYPLAGGSPFIAFTQAKDLNTSALLPGNIYLPDTSRTVTRVTEGEHRSPLDPQYSLDAFFEYHTELISFIYSNGTAIQVNNPAIIK
ncbi:hypothetical protein WCX49_11505 [Sulfurimonas sp. HSL-1656]|uniref:hypothetical protein n=1 Tax=Thiomicrolovo subterrani TaxID=3131934 RepID=UPI0031F99E1F